MISLKENSLTTASDVITKINILYNQILIDFKVLKNSLNNEASKLGAILLNQIEQLNAFLLNFTGKQKSVAGNGGNGRFKNSLDTNLGESSVRLPSSEEKEFIQRNNEVFSLI